MRMLFMLVLSAGTVIPAVRSFSGPEAGTNLVAETQPADSYLERLQSDDPNYFVYAKPLETGELEEDAHIEFYLSIKYAFNLWQNSRAWQPDRLALIYNGLYDFYLIEGGRYESAPIISRRQNPGAALEWIVLEQGVFRFGYFHESNGQSISGGEDSNGNSIDDGAEAFALAESKGGYEYALSRVSRGWDYVTTRYQHSGGEDWPWLCQLDLRWFLTRQGFGSADQEDNIFWEPVTDQPSIQDYDGLRIMCELPICRDRVLTRLELKAGTSDWEALGNLGGKASLNFALGRNFWLTTFYFNGYGKDPSTYHLRAEYAGVGFEIR